MSQSAPPASRHPTASALACSALGLQAEGEPHRGDATQCDMCGTHIAPGDLCTTIALPRTFFDFGHFPKHRSGLACGHCTVVARQSTLRHLQRSVVTADAVYGLGEDIHRAGFWLQPPKPPFFVILNKSTTGAYHYAWRTPVTLDDQLVYVNSDDVVVSVNRPKVLAALEAARILIERAQVLAVDDKDLAKQLVGGKGNSPFRVLYRAPTSEPAVNGAIAPWVSAMLSKLHTQEQALLRPHVQVLASCKVGEQMALSGFLKSKPLPPVPPPAFFIRGKATPAWQEKEARKAQPIV